MAGPEIPQMLQEEFDMFAVACFRDCARLLRPQEYVDHRRTFFAGVSAFLGLSMRALSPEAEMTDLDERLVRAIYAELREFNEAVKRGEK